MDSGEEVSVFLSHLPPSSVAVPIYQGITDGRIVKIIIRTPSYYILFFILFRVLVVGGCGVGLTTNEEYQ